MRLIGKSSHYERILAYLKNPDADISELTPKEQEMVTRWMEAFTLQRNYNTPSDAAAILMKRFPGLSRPTAFRDCGAALALFGDLNKSTKEGIRFLATEITKDAINIARIKNNEDGMMKGAKNIAAINGVNLNDPDMPDFEKLQPNTYNINLPPAALEVVMGMIKGGKVDLGSMVSKMQDTAEDAQIIEDEPNS
jgi:hypothetical protein